MTGSTGKSSCKETLVAFLTPHVGEKLKYTGSGNSDIGICYEILGLPVKKHSTLGFIGTLFKAFWQVLTFWEQFDVFVVEMGIDSPYRPNNMTALLRIIRPHVGVFISVGTVHGFAFDHLVDPTLTGEERNTAIKKLIANEKFNLIRSLENRSHGFVAHDIVSFLPSEDLKNVRIIGTGQDFSLVEGGNTLQGFSGVVKYKNKRYTVEIPNYVLPPQALLNLEAATKILDLLKFDLDKSYRMLPTLLRIEPGRSSILPGIEKTVIIDSSYNANIDAAVGLLHAMRDMTKHKRRRRVVVLGELRENGLLTQKIHEDLIEEAVKVADLLILTNTEMLKYGIPKAKELGFAMNENLFWFKNGKQLSYHIKNMIEENDVILFEGSQNEVFLEFAVEQLLANQDPSYVAGVLPRMRSDWKKIKSQIED
ncbi:MAG: cyanophycin synthetase [Candidatus Dojkabacteria bacterium]|nr:MAG: cyanophycin synthetase [Candidatus Dojkabacteria bacterium]